MNAAIATDRNSASPLLADTPNTWFDLATERWRELLNDHANCEKKAASTALSLIFAYAEDRALVTQLSRLAREELRHFEQVQKVMSQLEVPFMRLAPSRYADGLRRAMRRDEPLRQLDLLLCGALIEARSHERFVLLGPRPAEPLSSFYAGLAEAEARHLDLYSRLAAQRFDAAVCAERLRALGEVGAELATAPDAQFRFHSGAPAA